MSFTNPIYYLFLFASAVVYSLLRRKNHRQVFVVVLSSLFSISFGWISFFILFGLSLVNYALLVKLIRTESKKSRAVIYTLSISANVFFLILYKLIQAPWLLELQKADFSQANLIFLGFSFYVLQCIGYFFEVYKKRYPFDLGFREFYLSLAFFSKLPEGPILQASQIKSVFVWDGKVGREADFSFAIHRILLGLFKKIVLADRLGFYIDQVFDDHLYMNGLRIYLAFILFTIQLYLDFSGFIDIAIGSARLFGVSLPENFNFPLRATSIISFWRRWHMSLVNWLTSYVFYPLSFRWRKLKAKGLVLAVVITFLISALWHGLAVTFLVWAACHIIFIVLEHWLLKNEESRSVIKRTIRIFVVWNLVSFANIFFRSRTLADAFLLLQDVVHKPFLYAQGSSLKTWLINGGQDIEAEFNFRLSVLLCILFLFLERKIMRYANEQKYQTAYVAIMLILIVVFGVFRSEQNFIYTRF